MSAAAGLCPMCPTRTELVASHRGSLAGTLYCPHCGRRFDVDRSGRFHPAVAAVLPFTDPDWRGQGHHWHAIDPDEEPSCTRCGTSAGHLDATEPCPADVPTRPTTNGRKVTR